MFSRFIALTAIATLMVTPVAAQAAMLKPASIAAGGLNASLVDYRPFAHRHLDRPYYRENDSRVRSDSDAGPRERPDLYRGFDRERIYTQSGPARGPSGERKLLPAFRDGHTFTLFGN